MIDGLPPYPAYRPAKLKWLGEVPDHWIEKRAKYFYREVDERSTTGEEELLSVSHKTGVTPRPQHVTMFKAESNVGHKICRPENLVINTMWAFMGALGVANQVGVVSPSYGVYHPINRGYLNPEYIDQLLRIEDYKAEYLCRSTGIRSSRLRLYPDEFLRIPVLCPPVEEQFAIVRFLSHVDRRIRRYIRAKRQLLELLSEEREALTDAGVRSSNTVSIRLGAAVDKVAHPIQRRGERIYTPIGLLNRGRGIFHKVPTRGADLGDSTFFWIEPGDLVFSGQFAWEGAIAQAGEEDDGCIASHRYPVLRGKRDVVETAYLLSFFRTQFGHFLLNEHSRGAAGRNRPLNIGTLLKEKIPIPPLPEQRRIVALVPLENRLARAVAIITEQLREYRTRLITDVVTGKLDVREAATQLPDEVDDNESVADELDIGEDATNDAELDAEPEEVEA